MAETSHQKIKKLFFGKEKKMFTFALPNGGKLKGGNQKGKSDRQPGAEIEKAERQIKKQNHLSQ